MAPKKKIHVRHKLKKHGAKRWKKGHSSSCNPETKLFRKAALNRFFNINTGPSHLTTAALAKHDACQSEGSAIEVDNEDSASVGSWASNWTACTNTTFSRVHSHWASNSALHKEILAVLAAVTEVIKSKDGQETETEYFAALLTALTTIEGDMSLAAVTYLLSLCIKRVPIPVLKTQFSEITTTLMTALGTHTDTNTPALLRWLIVCVAHVLRVQESAVWTNSSTLQLYQGLLVFTTHCKPKVRKAAEQAVCAVLRGSPAINADDTKFHPAVIPTAEFCLQQLRKATTDISSVLHVLSLLKDVLPVFPKSTVKSTCEAILRLLSLPNLVLTSVAMQALHGLFIGRPKASSLPAELNAQIISALYDYQPSINDAQPIGAWLSVLEKAHTNLSRNDAALCMSHLPRMFAAGLKCLLSEHASVKQVTKSTLKAVLLACVPPACSARTTHHHLMKIITSLQIALGYKYHASWPCVLQIIATFIQVSGKLCAEGIRPCLVAVSELHNSDTLSCRHDAQAVFAAAVKVLGPRLVLDAVPLDITGERDDYNFTNSWLLPVLKDNIQQTELAFFIKYFLPLAEKLRTKAETFAANQHTVESKTYDSLYRQMWSLLPAFCKKTTDLSESFRGLAKTLGTMLTDRPELQMDVMTAIRNLVSHSVTTEASRAELSRYSKNFLPLLFNLFTTDSNNEKDPKRRAVLETIKSYLKVTESQLFDVFYDKCYTKINDPAVTSFKRCALLDLSAAMVPYISEDKLDTLFTFTVGRLQCNEKTEQKKCYRVLEQICASKTESCTTFLASHLDKLQAALAAALSSTRPPSKVPRLQCLVHVFKQLQTADEQFMRSVVPEAILATKETAERARTTSVKLLFEMGTACLRWASDRKQSETIGEFIGLLLAGLGGTCHMVSCTVLAITYVLRQFRGIVDCHGLSHLIDHACLLLTSQSRDTVLASLSLLKVVVSVFPDTTLAGFLEKIVTSLVSMREESRHHLRFKTKELLARLARKFGFESVLAFVPASHQKVLTNIRKTEARVKRRRKEGKTRGHSVQGEDEAAIRTVTESIEDLLRDTDSEVDDIVDDADTTREKKKTGRRRSGRKDEAWLQEASAAGDDNDDGIVDFLDPAVSKKVLATKPKQKKEETKAVGDHGFQVAPDGRLIIREDKEEEEDSCNNKKGKTSADDSDDEDIGELMDAMGIHSKKNRKRKISVDADDQSVSKYQAGGHGIHRPIGAAAVSVAKKKKKKDTVQRSMSGEQYQAKKGRGDHKVSGQHDPFAYVPLQFQSLNKRKQAKRKGQFQNLVKGAKKGALHGQKMKGKRKL